MAAVTSGDKLGSRVAVGDVVRTLSQADNNVVSELWHQRCGGHCSVLPAVSTVKMCVYLVGFLGLPVITPRRAGNS